MRITKSPLKGLTVDQIESAQQLLDSEAGQHIENISVVGSGYHIQTPKEAFTGKDSGKKDPRSGKPIITKIKLDGMYVGGEKVKATYTRDEVLAVKLDVPEPKVQATAPKVEKTQAEKDAAKAEADKKAEEKKAAEEKKLAEKSK